MAWGKIIGGTLGALLGGPIGAGVGLAIGAGVDESDDDQDGDSQHSPSLMLEQNGNVLRVTVAGRLPPQADGAMVRIEHHGEFVKAFVPLFADDDEDFAFARPITNQSLSVDIPLYVLSITRHERCTIGVLVGVFDGEEQLGVLAASIPLTIGMQPWRIIDWMVPAVDVLCHYALRSGRWTPAKIQRIKATFGELFEQKGEEAEALKERLKLSQRPPLAASIESYHRRFGEPELSMLLLACVADLLRMSAATNNRVADDVESLGRQLGLDADQIQEALDFGESDADRSKQSSGDAHWACGILGIAVGSNADAIQLAWRKKISELHPDKYTSLPDVVQTLIKEKAQELNRARDILLSQ